MQAAAGEIGDGMKLRLSIRDARLRDGRVRVVDPARGKEWTVGIAEARLRAASLAAPMRIAIRGTFGGEDFSIEGDGPAIEALGVGAGWPISVKGALAKKFPSNKELSDARADSAAQALRDGGVANLTAAGHGENDPVASNNTAAGRAKNRRVEVIVK